MDKIISDKENNIPKHIEDGNEEQMQDFLPYKKLEEEFTIKYSVPDERSFERLVANMVSKGFKLKSKEGSEAVFSKNIDGSYDI